MVDKPIDTTSVAGSTVTGPWIEPGRADELMELVLDYYIKHHQVVFKKLHKAQEATHKSIAELEGLSLAAGTDAPPADEAKLHIVREYDQMWEQIITLFKAHGATEEDLARIEDILLGIPRTIKRHYDMLVQQDRELQALIASLKTEEYKKACQIISKVQSMPNPMTGLTHEEYVSAPVAEVLPTPSSYQISPHILRNDD